MQTETKPNRKRSRSLWESVKRTQAASVPSRASTAIWVRAAQIENRPDDDTKHEPNSSERKPHPLRDRIIQLRSEHCRERWNAMFPFELLSSEASAANLLEKIRRR